MTDIGRAVSRWPRPLAWVAVTIALLDFFGWVARIPLLVGTGLAPVTMKFATALGVLATASVLLLRARGKGDPSRPAVGVMTALGVLSLSIGVAVLVARSSLQSEPALIVRTLVDRAPDGVSHGLPSALAGVVLSLFGTWAIIDVRERARRLAAGTAISVLAICVLAIVGLVFHVSATDETYFTQLATPTIVAFAALALGVLALRPNYGVLRLLADSGAGGLVFRRLVIASIGIPFVLGWLRLLTHERDWVAVVPGIAIYALAMMLAFTAVSWVVALQLSASEFRRDASERARRLVERRFRSAFDHAGIGMAIVGLDGRWIDINDSIESIVGYERDELLQRTFQDITHPDDLSTDLAYVDELLSGKRNAYSMDKRYCRKDGAIVHVTLTGSIIRDDEGNPLHFLATVQDISPRVEAERALREAFEVQRAITEGADLSIISTELDGTIRTFNPGAERMLGYGADEVIGRVTPAILHDQREVAARAAQLSREFGLPYEPGFEVFVAAARRGVADQREWTYVRKDGSRLRVLLSVTSLRDAAGEITAFLGIASDVSVLYATTGALEVANREKEVLLREVHHRVKNNLQVVSSVLNLQAKYSQDPAVVQMFDDSRDRVRAMALIHERLQGATGFDSVDFTAYARDLVALMRVASAPSRSSVVLAVEGEPVHISIDMATPLGLILNELVSNALKHAFGPDDGGRVTVSIKGGDEGVRMTVSNGGHAIPSGLNLESGTSLGLRLVRALITQVDGRLQVVEHPEPAVRVEAPWPARQAESGV